MGRRTHKLGEQLRYIRVTRGSSVHNFTWFIKEYISQFFPYLARDDSLRAVEQVQLAHVLSSLSRWKQRQLAHVSKSLGMPSAWLFFSLSASLVQVLCNKWRSQSNSMRAIWILCEKHASMDHIHAIGAAQVQNTRDNARLNASAKEKEVLLMSLCREGCGMLCIHILSKNWKTSEE